MLSYNNGFTGIRPTQYLRSGMKSVFQILNEMVGDGAISNYAIGGAIGAVFYVEPFATRDVDVFVMMKAEASGLLTSIPGWAYLNDRGYKEVRGEAIVVEDWPVQVAIMLKAGRLKDRARVEMFLSQDAVDRDLLIDIVKRHRLDKEWAEFQSYK